MVRSRTKKKKKKKNSLNNLEVNGCVYRDNRMLSLIAEEKDTIDYAYLLKIISSIVYTLLYIYRLLGTEEEISFNHKVV